MKNVIITGGAGYIGSVLVGQLLDKKYNVCVFDCLNFGGESLLGVYNHPNFSFIKGDIRDKDALVKALSNKDAVIHLAAIVGDPACAKQKQLAEETNWYGSKLLFDLAVNEKGIRKFISASTCSNYGKMENDQYLNEDSPMRPVSLYAELKVKFEKYLLESKTRNDFIPTSLRFATVYGLSPRMRFDLTVNEFIKDVVMGKELEIFGEQFWRPYAHVEDLARSVVCVLEADNTKVDHEVFGVGDTEENYQKKMIAEEILKIEPSAKVKYVSKNEDPRDYRVNFDKIKNKLNYRITKKVPVGLIEIYHALKNGIISDPNSQKYKNI
jgi:nucleoside-diphosphate-sugar epimerase